MRAAFAGADRRDRWPGRRAVYYEPGFGWLEYAVVWAARNAFRRAAEALSREADRCHRDDDTRHLVESLDELAAEYTYAAQQLTDCGSGEAAETC